MGTQAVSSAPPENESKKTIVVVDDNVDAGKPLAMLLSRSGHRGLHINSGEAALDFVSQSVPDLMILDMMMPGIDGLEVLRALRANPKTASLPIVIFSAVSDPNLRAHAMDKGANDYWVKSSLDFGELSQRVDRLLNPEAR